MKSRANLFILAVLGIFFLCGTDLVGAGGPASNPFPLDGSAVPPEYWDESVFMILDYTPGEGAISHTAYFSDNFDDVANRDSAHCLGSNPPWPEVSVTAFVVGCSDPGVPEYAWASLSYGTTYYWCVDADDGTTIWPGPVWSFTVMPHNAWNPTPPDGAENVGADPSVILSWQMGDVITVGYAISYDVYYDTSLAAVEGGTAAKVHVAIESATVGPLTEHTLYYWRVDTIQRKITPPFNQTVIPGDTWSFTTAAGSSIVDPDLVAHWKFDEGEGSVAYDSAGDNDGTIYDATWTDGILGGALNFDGSGDRVEVPDSPSLHPVSGLFSLAAWVKTERTPANQASIVVKGPAYDENYGLYVLASSGFARFQFSSGGAYTENETFIDSLSNVFDSSWHHLVGTFDGSQLILYIDGTLDVTGSMTEKVPDSSDGLLTVGARDDPLTKYFDGLVDDVRVYDVALSADEVEELYGEVPPQPVGLVSHWRFDEGEGSVAYDSAGTNDGTIYGASWADGVLGGAMQFDDVDDYVAVDDDPSMRVNQYSSFSVSAWVNPLFDGWLFSKMRANERRGVFGYSLRWEQLTSRFNFIVEQSWSTQSAPLYSSAVAPGSWHHVVVVYDNKDKKIYVNGGLHNSGLFDRDTGSTEPDKHFVVGARSWDYTIDGYFGGSIDDVRFYNKALTADEIAELYGEIPPVVEGETWHVDGLLGSDDNDGLSPQTAFATIQKGIDVAEDDDSVLVWPGVYTEEVRFKGKAITVRSAGDAATIQNPDDFAVSFYYGEGPGSVLKNFVVANSLTGIFIAGSSPTISNVTVVNNVFGIEAYNGSEPAISNAILWDNIESDIYGCEAKYSWLQSDSGPAEPTEGLAAHWKFDEAEGTVTGDSVGDNHGTIIGQANWTAGRLGGALDFDGVDGYVSIPDAPSQRFSQYDSFSISAWAKPSPGSYLFNKMRANNRRGVFGYIVVASSTTFEFIVEKSYSGATKVIWPYESDGGWYHVTAVYDNKDMKLYVNGVLEASGRFGYDTGDTEPDKDLAIGAWSWDSTIDKFYDGEIDDVRIYARALSAEEIEALYSVQMNGDPLFADPASGDYHLRSERGRYWPEHNIWVLDDVSSPCLDAGDPNDDPRGERMPNGGLINMGAYGGTPYASMSEWPLAHDRNKDGRTDFKDLASFCDEWLLELPWAAPPGTPAADRRPPEPDPATWDIEPYATSSSSILMAATASVDENGVEYYFENTTIAGHTSGWQDPANWTDSSLTSSTQYCYRVKTRDKSPNANESGWSSTLCATTSSGGR